MQGFTKVAHRRLVFIPQNPDIPHLPNSHWSLTHQNQGRIFINRFLWSFNPALNKFNHSLNWDQCSQWVSDKTKRDEQELDPKMYSVFFHEIKLSPNVEHQKEKKRSSVRCWTSVWRGFCAKKKKKSAAPHVHFQSTGPRVPQGRFWKTHFSHSLTSVDGPLLLLNQKPGESKEEILLLIWFLFHKYRF